ncbi:MAG TPA: glycine cleavage system protein GcvH [Solirubrobacteraceae bacterium]|nr:glycine cleavage system protein GcvH [Solirubrobacteraceae bacterium]
MSDSAAAEHYPDDLLYHPEHDWARIEDGEATLGITWYAQDTLGEVVFYEPPALGTQLRQGEMYAEIESVKAVAEVLAPLSGEIIAVNETLGQDPGPINADPYGAGWLVRIRLADEGEREALMDAESYRALLAGGGASSA